MSSNHPPLSLAPTDRGQVLRVIAVGSLEVVNNYVLTQHRLGFAQVSEWSRPLPAPNARDIMRILTKRLGSQASQPPEDPHPAAPEAGRP
ncbi:hypothetical protein XM38_034280 [Halomicronema hongdechloris C2206]|uniref:Uncharacterized protein n=1 Tax=Halomicronema hongdechloris C2206 TaxID=1641165 RepID=A0A1Z3HQ87_9CYAN|nr:hypothetical protein [Halomicronema hongdechloris]ASC72471.1 hypothetical protein XM38_034280 [Halomicronema hongdechloris C2206]